MGNNHDNRGGYNGRGRNRRGWNKGGRNNGWQNEGNQQNGNNQNNGNNQQNGNNHHNGNNQQNGNNQHNGYSHYNGNHQQNQQNQRNGNNQNNGNNQSNGNNQNNGNNQSNGNNQNNGSNQQNGNSQQNGNNQQNGNLANNGQKNSKCSNDTIHWKTNGWIGADSNNTDDDNNNNGHNDNHCCFWQEVSQNPFLRQITAQLSQFMANNKRTFYPNSPPPSIDAIMTEARQAKTDWRKKVDGIQGAQVLLETKIGNFIGQALHGYFSPCMNPDILDETYMMTEQDVDAPASQCVGKYTVHSRHPIIPNGPKELEVQIKVTKSTMRVEMLVCPRDTDGYNFVGPVGAMNWYQKTLVTPIEGYTVTGQIDQGPKGMYLALIMGQSERAWDYVYANLLKCPQ